MTKMKKKWIIDLAAREIRRILKFILWQINYKEDNILICTYVEEYIKS